MSAAIAHKLIAHFGGSIPLPDAETVFRTWRRQPHGGGQLPRHHLALNDAR